MTRGERSTQLLRNAVPGPAPAADVPDALIEKIRGALAQQRARRQRTRIVTWAAAAAIAAAAVTAAFWLKPHATVGAVTVASFEGAAVLTPPSSPAVALTLGMGVAEGSLVTTHAGGHAELALQTGGEVELMESTELAIAQTSAEQRIVVHEGRTRLHVKTLAKGHTLVVATEDAEVEVKGTRFEVEVVQVDAACDVATTTRVHVDEGTVWVRHGSDRVELRAGEAWPRCGLVEPTPTRAPDLAPQAPAPVVPAAVVPSTPPALREASLSEQNARYREAIAARRRGDVKSALAAFEAFYRAHPNSPMAEAARVERLRLLNKMSDPAVAAAASEYLSEYPNGFARDEARAIVGR